MTAFFDELWMILAESSLWLLFGFLLAGIMHVLISRDWMLKHLGGQGIIPILKASLLGIPLPLCSCAVIPVAAGLRKQGATKGASAAFAISTPQTGEESIPLTWGLFGPFFALTRPVIAVITALIAGILIDLTHKNESNPEQTPESKPVPDQDTIEDPNAIGLSITNAADASAAVEQIDKKATGACCSSKPKPEPSSCCSSSPEPAASSCCSSTPQKSRHGLAGPLKAIFTHGFGVMLVDLAIWLSIGLIMAAIIGSAVPPHWFEEHVGNGIGPKLIMLVVGIPLYICATSSTPLAFGLVVAGLSPGAALVLLLSGPATNVATMSWLIKDLGIKALIIYLGTIAAIALAAGVVFDLYFVHTLALADHANNHEHAVPLLSLKGIAAIIFIVLIAWALGMKARKWMNTKGWGATKSSDAGCCSSGGCGCS